MTPLALPVRASVLLPRTPAIPSTAFPTHAEWLGFCQHQVEAWGRLRRPNGYLAITEVSKSLSRHHLVTPFVPLPSSSPSFAKSLLSCSSLALVLSGLFFSLSRSQGSRAHIPAAFFIPLPVFARLRFQLFLLLPASPAPHPPSYNTSYRLAGNRDLPSSRLMLASPTAQGAALRKYGWIPIKSLPRTPSSYPPVCFASDAVCRRSIVFIQFSIHIFFSTRP